MQRFVAPCPFSLYGADGASDTSTVTDTIILYFQKFFYYVTKTFFIISSSFLVYGASVTLSVTVTFFAASDRFCISKVAAAFAGNDPVGKSFAF